MPHEAKIYNKKAINKTSNDELVKQLYRRHLRD